MDNKYKQVKYSELILELEGHVFNGGPDKLRGFFANTFTEADLFHNHQKEGEPIYRYPRIQYHFFKNRPVIIGVNEGVELIKKYYDKFDSIKIGNRIFKISEKELKFKTVNIGMAEDIISYRFISPWYALDESNYKQYMSLSSRKEKDDLLSRIMTSNILRMFKELGYYCEDKVSVNHMLFPKKGRFKNFDVIIFTGHFKTNVKLPEFLGIGRSVAKGFGSISKFC